MANYFLKFVIISLLVLTGCAQKSGSSDNYSEQAAKGFIQQVPDPDSIHWETDSNHFSWQAGYIMFAMEKMWDATGDSVYFNYIKRYVDQQVDEQGNVTNFENDALDNFLPGYAIIFMYEETGLEKYKIAATHVRNGLIDYPRTSNGLFIHAISDWSKEQVWVDGVIMGQIFLARYGSVIGDSEYAFDEVVKQMTLIIKKCQKPNGLLLHGWDPTKKAVWADPGTGLSPEVWSEGLGWFAVLIADVFDYLPKDQTGRERLMNALQELCYGLKEAQDTETGMWCQVVDKCDQPGNWNETSGSGMFLYLLKTSMEKDYIPEDVFEPVVKKAYDGIIQKAVSAGEGHIDLIDCSSIGVQENYEAYISQPKEVSPFAAFGSFIIGTSAMEYSPVRSILP
jgi:rhamnogalacturonyl hydrolase YesR